MQESLADWIPTVAIQPNGEDGGRAKGLESAELQWLAVHANFLGDVGEEVTSFDLLGRKAIGIAILPIEPDG